MFSNGKQNLILVWLCWKQSVVHTLFEVLLTEKFESGEKAVVLGLQTAFPSLELVWKMV